MDRIIIKQEIIDIESSDSDREVSAEDVQQNVPDFTSLLPAQEPISTTTQSEENEPVYDIYTYDIPEILINSTTQDMKEFENGYEFQLRHPKEDDAARWAYSSRLDQLYAIMNVDCPFLFKIKPKPPSGTFVRATPVYIRPEDSHNFPKRCLNHADLHDETNRDHPKPEHLMRCNLPGTDYTKDETTGRMSTILPYVSPPHGSNVSTYVIKFMCRTSCAGGMNRRPMAVIFTLEYNGKCLGRQVRKVKVCACPGRDRMKDERRLEDSTTTPSTYRNVTLAQDVKKACKRISASLGSNTQKNSKQRKVYTLTVHSRVHYNILSALIPVLDKNLGTTEEDLSEDEG